VELKKPVVGLPVALKTACGGSSVYSKNPVGTEPLRLDAGLIATGVMLIERGVFEALATPERKYLNEFYDFFPCGMDSRRLYLSEDYAFCRNAEAQGFENWLLPAKTRHFGRYGFSL
jgi:hypothetical protein